MKKVLYFIKDYWLIPAFVLITILGWVILRKRGTPIAQTLLELKAIEAGRYIRELKTQQGVEEAKKIVYQEYMDKMTDMTSKQQAQAERLKNDPIALSQFLVRASGSN